MFEKILYNSKSIIKACSVLKNGGIIVYPTDTIYGSEDYKNANKHLKDTLVMAVNDDLKGILPYIDTKV